MNTGPNKRFSKVVFNERLYIPPDDNEALMSMKPQSTDLNRSPSQIIGNDHSRQSVTPKIEKEHVLQFE